MKKIIEITPKDLLSFNYFNWSNHVSVEVRSLLRDFTIPVYFNELKEKWGFDTVIVSADKARNVAVLNMEYNEDNQVIGWHYSCGNVKIPFRTLKEMREDNIREHFITKFDFIKTENSPILKYIEKEGCLKLVQPETKDLQEIYVKRIEMIRGMLLD
jgi:hypothetical protein